MTIDRFLACYGGALRGIKRGDLVRLVRSMPDRLSFDPHDHTIGLVPRA